MLVKVAPGRYLNQCWFTVNWSFGYTFLRCLNQNTISKQVNEIFEDFCCKMAIILFRHQCVKWYLFSTVICEVNHCLSCSNTNNCSSCETGYSGVSCERKSEENDLNSLHIVLLWCIKWAWPGDALRWQTVGSTLAQVKGSMPLPELMLTYHQSALLTYDWQALDEIATNLEHW